MMLVMDASGRGIYVCCMRWLVIVVVCIASGCGDPAKGLVVHRPDATQSPTDVGGRDTSPAPADQGEVRSSVTVTGPAWQMCGDSAANAAAPNTFPGTPLTISLGNPGHVQSVELSLQGPAGGWEPPVASWDDPTGDVTHAVSLGGAGTWHARAVITQRDGATVESNHHAIECRRKTLAVAASDAAPRDGAEVVLTASCLEGCEYPYAAAQWFYDAGAGWVADAGANPHTWPASGTFAWLWQERFEDGSVINSSSVQVAPIPYDITPGTYDGATITALLQGKATFTWAPGDYTITSQFFIPSNVYITATGANIKLTGGSIKNAAPADCGVVGDNHYTHAGGFTWDGGTIYRDQGDSLMSFAHAPSLTVMNTTFFRYATADNMGHAIEINAVGGPNMGTNPNAATGPYTVRIVNNRFLGVDQGQRPNSNDEPIQYDWAYSEGAAGAKVCPNQTDVMASTMCHNVEISGNTFHRYAEVGGWQFGLCAIGGHKSAEDIVGTRRLPTNRHNNFLIANNEIHGAVGSTGTNPDKGAIHLFALRGVTVTGNNFFGCDASRLVTYEIDGNAAGEVESSDFSYITSQVTPVHRND